LKTWSICFKKYQKDGIQIGFFRSFSKSTAKKMKSAMAAAMFDAARPTALLEANAVKSMGP